MLDNSDQEQIAISKDKADLLHQLIQFNVKHIYHSDEAERYKKQAKHALNFLFEELIQMVASTKRFTENGDKAKLLRATDVYKVLKQFVTEDMKGQYGDQDPDSLIVLDFIAGMTDNFAISTYI